MIVSFVLEDGSGLEGGNEDLSGANNFENYDAPPEVERSTVERGNSTHDISSYRNAHEPSVLQNIEQLSTTEFEQNKDFAVHPSNPGTGLVADISSPASIAELTRRHDEQIHGRVFSILSVRTPGSTGTAGSPEGSLPTPGGPNVPRLSRREAFLIQHYVQKLAPWVCSFLYSH